MSITTRYHDLRQQVPADVTLVVAAKTRTPQEIREVIAAGATDVGQNYVQEALAMRASLRDEAEKVTWHMIGHLQHNKINKALRIFDVIQTVDSLDTARALDKRVDRAGKTIVPCYIEINIGNEDTKAGIKPEEHEPFEEYMVRMVRDMSALGHLQIEGLMTMGPRFGNAEESRPYFKRIKRVFDMLNGLGAPRVDMRYLSMGMTNSYRVAIEEGSNMVRIGTGVFGERAG
jgi:pyridoxal phosphate enzyme (YggS family)